MVDILQDFPIRAPQARVFRAISTPPGMDTWWTQRAAGQPRQGAQYELDFGPGYAWRAKVARCEPEREFELEVVSADDDWLGTRVGFSLEPRRDGTWVRFRHTGWKTANEHYRVSTHCWAMFLRILRRSLEHGESVEYEARLSV